MFEHKKRRLWPKVLLVITLVLLIGAGAGVFALRQWYTGALKPVTAQAEVVEVQIASGSTPKIIGQQLKDLGLIRDTRAFETYIRGTGDAGKLKAGTFALSASMSVQEIVSVLIQGKEVATLFTIPPGLRVDQIKKRFIDAGYDEASVETAFNVATYKDMPIIAELPEGATLEGFIYPETFQIGPNSTPSTIVRQSLTELQKILTPDLRSALAEQNLNVFQAITLASIVEKEVPGTEDRKVVAQIFISRLDQGIELGSDATYYYASVVFGGEPFPSLESPYNTRKYTGLPPGPINNVSKTALEAVAYPSDTDYLFFVTGDDGVNHFTRTDAEHQAAVKKYCTISCAPGYIPPNYDN